MGDLIWIGNTLMPRGTVIIIALAIIVIVSGIIAAVTR
jgi:hypothetical protein